MQNTILKPNLNAHRTFHCLCHMETKNERNEFLKLHSVADNFSSYVWLRIFEILLNFLEVIFISFSSIPRQTRLKFTTE